MKRRVFLGAAAAFLLAQTFASPVFAAETAAGLDYDYKNSPMAREEFFASLDRIFHISKLNQNYAAPPFNDIDLIEPENMDAVKALYTEGFLSGYASEDGFIYARPDQAVTRQEAVTIIAMILGVPDEVYTFDFSDESLIAPYALNHAMFLAEMGILGLSSGEALRPGEAFTVGDFEDIAGRAYDFTVVNESVVYTIAGTGSGGHEDGEAIRASFTMPYGVFAMEGEILVFDTYNNMIRKIADDKTETVTGQWLGLGEDGFPIGYSLDGTLEEAIFNRPAAGAVNSFGEVIIAEAGGDLIRMITYENTLGRTYTFSGSSSGYADSRDDEAMFSHPTALAVDDNDVVYVADTLNNCIRVVQYNGDADILAGQPRKEGYADGSAEEALFRNPSGIAVTADGKTVYVADTGNHVIRMVKDGMVSTIAGNIDGYDEDGDPLGGFADGPSGTALFNLPMGLTLARNILVVADSGNNMLRSLSLGSGEVNRIAGTGNPGDFSAGALVSRFQMPMGVHYYNGVLYIADTGNNKIKAMDY